VAVGARGFGRRGDRVLAQTGQLGLGRHQHGKVVGVGEQPLAELGRQL
jgi:hypothetical protein